MAPSLELGSRQMGAGRNSACGCAGSVAILLRSGDTEWREKHVMAPARASKLVWALLALLGPRQAQRRPMTALWGPRGWGSERGVERPPREHYSSCERGGGDVGFARGSAAGNGARANVDARCCVGGSRGRFGGGWMCVLAISSQRALLVRRGVGCVIGRPPALTLRSTGAAGWS